jgi:hypothetical protein
MMRHTYYAASFSNAESFILSLIHFERKLGEVLKSGGLVIHLSTADQKDHPLPNRWSFRPQCGLTRGSSSALHRLNSDAELIHQPTAYLLGTRLKGVID